jgi:hypothetical protein
MHIVTANKDELETAGLYDPEVWTQHFTRQGVAWRNKVQKTFDSIESAATEYYTLQVRGLVATKNWLGALAAVDTARTGVIIHNNGAQMATTDMSFGEPDIEDMFPCAGEEGTAVTVSPVADAIARRALWAGPDSVLDWHVPDVFSIRYGSSYVATATYRDNSLRFHTVLEGDSFQDGDDCRMPVDN